MYSLDSTDSTDSTHKYWINTGSRKEHLFKLLKSKHLWVNIGFNSKLDTCS